jgi:hypothetical protein
MSTDRVGSLLPESREKWTYWAAVNDPDIDNWIGYQGFFKTPEEVTTFAKGLS